MTPKEKYAFTIGVREYQAAETRFQYRSLTNPAQNAYQMTRFLRRHNYSVASNIKEYEDVVQKRARATFSEDIEPQLDHFLQLA